MRIDAARLWGDCRESAFAFLIAAAFVAAPALLYSPPPQEEYDGGEFYGLDAAAPSENAAEKSAPETETAAAELPPPWLEYKIRRNDTMERILKNICNLKICISEDGGEILLAQKLKSYRLLRKGDVLEYRQDGGELTALRYKTSPEYYLHAGRGEDGKWWANETPPVLSTALKKAGGKIESSLFAAADKAGLNDKAIDLLIEALETQVDFHRDARRGDSFRAIYTEILDEDGQTTGAGKMLAVEYTSMLRPKKPRRIRGAWNEKYKRFYSDKGESMQGMFLRAPLKFRRISSRFTRRRFHPVLKRWRSHRGVDYAAASGTSVRATADGTVSLHARQRGYGKVVMVKHMGIYTTVYAHLSRFGKGIKRGRKVRQGQTIGYVGQTGLATGPHLHYEFRVRGKHKDPLSASVPKVAPSLSGKPLAEFQAAAKPLFAQLDGVAVQ